LADKSIGQFIVENIACNFISKLRLLLSQSIKQKLQIFLSILLPV